MLDFDGPEDDIDDDWDWDTELGLLEPAPDLAATRRPWVAPARYVAPPRERDEQVAPLTPDDVGEFVRACRAVAGFSQRELAQAAGVQQSTVARIEAGQGSGVQLATIWRLAGACDVALVGAVGGTDGQVLHTDRAQRHHDAEGRMLPAHLINGPLPRYQGAWWGDERYTHRRVRPARSYLRRSDTSY